MKIKKLLLKEKETYIEDMQKLAPNSKMFYIPRGPSGLQGVITLLENKRANWIDEDGGKGTGHITGFEMFCHPGYIYYLED